MLSRYYWDTIATCVAPEVIMDSLRRTGFADVGRRVFGGLLSEYTASRPAAEEGVWGSVVPEARP
jgi:demethylmenaquinone methyltransferase/2-methoxy-6-polyprenyl-1,4-benzoquinol methylase